MQTKYKVPYLLRVPTGGVALTSAKSPSGNRFLRAFDDNLAFLRGYDVDRLLYWYRVHADMPAPGAPYASASDFAESDVKGITAGAFLMGAGAALQFREDARLREMCREIIAGIAACRDDDGFLLPVSQDEFRSGEYPNHARAWLTFGLLDAGTAGESLAFELARDMGDWFNSCDVLPYVKELPLGFQGILASTRLYDSPLGFMEDISVIKSAYQEMWWLRQLTDGDSRAIYAHPGSHPGASALSALEGYLDMYRVGGARIYLEATRAAMGMYETDWQHVGGGIAICARGTELPGRYPLDPARGYNELSAACSWILLNQRMHRLDPDNAHYADEIESSLYNALLAAQSGARGYRRYCALERVKDECAPDRADCCAAMGARLTSLLPQFLYSFTNDTIFADIYCSSVAKIPLECGEVTLRCETSLPDSGDVRIYVEAAPQPFTLMARIPRWAVPGAELYVNGNLAAMGRLSSYVPLPLREGDELTFTLPMALRLTRYSGECELLGLERWAVEHGPLLYAATGFPTPVTLSFDPENPAAWLEYQPAPLPRISVLDDDIHSFLPYVDISDEPFSVYPAIIRPNS